MARPLLLCGLALACVAVGVMADSEFEGARALFDSDTTPQLPRRMKTIDTRHAVSRPVLPPLPELRPFDAAADPVETFKQHFGYAVSSEQLQLYGDVQLDALRDLYAATSGPNGWANSTGWSVANNNAPCGNHTEPVWYGVSCSGSIVVRLSLAKNGLGGILPQSIGNLQYLQFVDFTGNSLIGPIPDTVANWTSIQQLNFDGNGLTGQVPDLGGLSSLMLFYAGANNLNGPLPPLAGCSSLQYLMLGNNHFTGNIPDAWLSLPISLLDVGFNSLTGVFPEQLCASSYLMTCGAYGNPGLRCPNQECSKCDLPTCNCEMNACLSPSDCANGLCATCGGSGPIYYCQ